MGSLSKGSLEERVAVVTGGARGIGEAIAKGLAARGAQVAIVDIDLAQAERTAPDGALVLAADIGAEGAMDAVVERCLERFGKIDILVNNAAAIPGFVPWESLDLEEWHRILRVNLDGTFLVTRAVTPVMRENGYGRIVNISSDTVLAGTRNFAHYVTGKGGIIAMTRALARELGPEGITVNAVAPGLTDTVSAKQTKHGDDSAFDAIVAGQCIPRRGVAADIAPPVAFLCSEESRWITGQLLVVDGGAVHN